MSAELGLGVAADVALGLKHVFLDETSEFHERIGSGLGRLSGGMGCHFELFDPARTDEVSTIIRLGLKEIEIAPNAPGQWSGAGHAQPGDEMFGGDGFTRLLQRVRHCSDKVAPVVEAANVD